MTNAQQTYARHLEGRLRPIQAALVAAANGGRNTRAEELPGLDARLAGIPDQLDAIRTWIEEQQPEPERRGGRR